MKKICALLLIGVVIVTSVVVLVGCQSSLATETTTNDNETLLPPTASTSYYDLVERDGNAYLVFHEGFDNSLANDEIQGGLIVAPFVRFSSLSDMKTSIVEGDLTESELRMVNRFSKDPVTGEIPLCNLNRLYEPILPDGMVCDVVYWRGSTYDFGVTDPNGYFGNYFPVSSAEKEKLIQEKKDLIFNNSRVTITKEEYEKERNAEVVYTETSLAKLKHILYSLENESGRLYVMEKYLLESSFYPELVNEVVPEVVYIFGENNGLSFYLVLSPLETATQRPSVAYVSSFGIDLFRESADTAVK